MVGAHLRLHQVADLLHLRPLRSAEPRTLILILLHPILVLQSLLLEAIMDMVIIMEVFTAITITVDTLTLLALPRQE